MIRLASKLGLIAMCMVAVSCKSRNLEGVENALESEKPEPTSFASANSEAPDAPGANEGANDKRVPKEDGLSLAASNSNPTVLAESRALTRDVEAQRRVMSAAETADAIKSIKDARSFVAGRGPTDSVLCFTSSTSAPKACLKEIRGDNSCLGSYYDVLNSCKTALKAAKSGRICYQSNQKIGKALISKYGKGVSTGLIGNYYSNFTNCTTAMANSYGSLVCMESARYSGKWFIADLENNASQIGPYFKNYAECAATF